MYQGKENNQQPNSLQTSEDSVVHNTQTICANELEKIAAGECLPEDLDELAGCLGQLFRIARLTVPVSAIVLAQARRKHFAGNIGGWTRWAYELTGYERAVLHHRRAIGDMLLAQREKNISAFRRLVLLTEDRLIVLTRLSHGELPAFMSMNAVEAMSRDRLREAVAEWLGEEPAPAAEREPELPGFSKLLDAVQNVKPQEVISYVDTPETANKFMHGGIVMMAAAVEFHKREKNNNMLGALRDALLDEAEKITLAMKEA